METYIIIHEVLTKLGCESFNIPQEAKTYSDIVWLKDTKKCSESEFNTGMAEYDAQEYARNREAEYPSIADLVVALYDTDDKSAVEAKRAAVKKKYPKP